MPKLRLGPNAVSMTMRVTALVLAAIAIMAAAVELSSTASSRSPAANANLPSLDPLDRDLERCRRLTPEQANDLACRRAWAESRRRFLGSPRAGQGG